MKVGDYYYRLRFRYVQVCVATKVNDDGMVVEGTAVPDLPLYVNRKEAKKVVYEHNGWKLKS